jgi:hypothetical protein
MDRNTIMVSGCVIYVTVILRNSCTEEAYESEYRSFKMMADGLGPARKPTQPKVLRMPKENKNNCSCSLTIVRDTKSMAPTAGGTCDCQYPFLSSSTLYIWESS